MRVFVAIAERGSLTAAARGLGKSVPAVVRTLSALERSVGARLLQRTTRKLSLTDEGALYLEHCRRILAAVEESQDALGRRRGEPGGLLTVTAPVRFGEMHVAPLAQEFLARHPRIRLRLWLVDGLTDLVEAGVDVAVRIARLGDSTFQARRLGTVRQVVCASPSLLERVGPPIRPEQLRDRPCIAFTGIAPSGAWTFTGPEGTVRVPVSAQLSCNQASAAVEACADGLGFGRFLSYQVRPLVTAGRLQLVLTDYEPRATPVSLLWSGGLSTPPRVRAFVDFSAPRLRAALGDARPG